MLRRDAESRGVWNMGLGGTSRDDEGRLGRAWYIAGMALPLVRLARLDHDSIDFAFGLSPPAGWCPERELGRW